MEVLKKITHNCKHATYLIEKRLAGRLSLREHIFLWVHLAACDVCRLYQKQTARINELIRQLFSGATAGGVTLDEQFKNDLHARITDELNKN
jgi:predicted anti-sigma-YlaC factor YlaD